MTFTSLARRHRARVPAAPNWGSFQVLETWGATVNDRISAQFPLVKRREASERNQKKLRSFPAPDQRSFRCPISASIPQVISNLAPGLRGPHERLVPKWGGPKKIRPNAFHGDGGFLAMGDTKWVR